MTAAVEVSDAVCAAERYIYSTDERCRAPRNERRARVHALTKIGKSAAEIGVTVGMSERNVVRLRSQAVAPCSPKLPTAQDISDERSAEMEQVADAAIDLACRLHDEDPAIVWEALARLNREKLQELAVVLLAAVPVDATIGDVFGWVCQLPVATAVTE